MENKIKTVLITGSSSGIGQATAYRFAQTGCNLIITYYKDQAEGEKTRLECLSKGAKAVLVLPLDLTNEESITNFFNKVREQFFDIDIFINNAGILIKKPLAEVSLEEISSQIETNLAGLIKITKLFLPYIKESVINLGSGLSTRGKAGFSVYSAAKFGVRGFTQSLAKEYPNLKVYMFIPSITATKMVGGVGADPSKMAAIIFNVAQGIYRAKSGADVKASDYRYGKFWKNFIVFGGIIKRIIKQ